MTTPTDGKQDVFRCEYLDLFEHWQSEKGTFDDIGEAMEHCLFMADHTDIAYRVLDQHNAVVWGIDPARDFFALFDDQQP